MRRRRLFDVIKKFYKNLKLFQSIFQISCNFIKKGYYFKWTLINCMEDSMSISVIGGGRSIGSELCR